jgi:O-antigen/teichoic acid export membrane protein
VSQVNGTPDAAGAEDRAIRVAEVRRRAVAGVAVLGARGVAVRALNFAGYVVLARLLGPADLGVVALGLTILFSASFFVDAGIGATLIRQAEPPAREDLQTVVFFQLGVALLFVAVTLAIAAPLGEVGWVAAVMVAAVPLTAFRTPGVVLLERELLYHRIAVVEIVEIVAFQAFAITAVVAGLGVWGVAAAGVVKTVVGTAMMLALGPIGLVAPVLHLQRLRSMFGFAGRFQAIGLVNLLRDQGLNIGIAAVAGTAVLGLWSLAYRLLQIPLLLFSTLWQVSFPAMARLVHEGEDARPLVERAVGIGAVATGALLAPLVGAAPAAVPAIFGSGWESVTSVLVWSCLGLIIAGPISVATAGYLFAAGDAATVLRSAVLHTIAWGLVTFPLLPVIGVSAVGVGHLVAAWLEAVILGRATARALQARFAGPLAMPALAAVGAAAAGWAIAETTAPSLALAAACAVLAEALFVVALLAVRRRTLLDTFRLAGRAAATARVRAA